MGGEDGAGKGCEGGSAAIRQMREEVKLRR